MPEGVKDFINGFGGRVILISLTTLTSICTSIGMLLVKNIDGELSNMKNIVNQLVLSDKLTAHNKLDISDHNKSTLLVNERFHAMDSRMIKMEEAMKSTADSLGRIERRLGQPPNRPE
jgi:hypothetical protein